MRPKGRSRCEADCSHSFRDGERFSGSLQVSHIEVSRHQRAAAHWRWLMRARAEESGRCRNGGGFDPQWRADSKELFYLAGQKMMAVEVAGGSSTFEPN